MKTQTKILGGIDILIGAYLIWTLVPLFETIGDFIRNEITMTILTVGLILGGVGLWTNIKIGWIANQLTGIHILLSLLAGTVIGLKKDFTFDSDDYFISFLIILIGARLLWTNKQQWLDEFKISSKLRLITILIGTIPSLVFISKGYT
jgi:hypothetical protein